MPDTEPIDEPRQPSPEEQAAFNALEALRTQLEAGGHLSPNIEKILTEETAKYRGVTTGTTKKTPAKRGPRAKRRESSKPVQAPPQTQGEETTGSPVVQ